MQFNECKTCIAKESCTANNEEECLVHLTDVYEYKKSKGQFQALILVCSCINLIFLILKTLNIVSVTCIVFTSIFILLCSLYVAKKYKDRRYLHLSLIWIIILLLQLIEK